MNRRKIVAAVLSVLGMSAIGRNAMAVQSAAPTVFSTVDEMLNAATLIEGQLVDTLGRVSENDGGEGRFKIVSRYGPEGGTADGGVLLNLVNSGTLMAKRLFVTDFVRPEWWPRGGSASNADWQPAIQSAIDYCQRAQFTGIKRLQLSCRTYAIFSKLTLKSPAPNYVRFPFTLAGFGANKEGACSIISWGGTSAPEMIELHDDGTGGANAYYNFQDFVLDGKNVVNIALRGKNAASFQFERVVVLNTKVNAIKFEQSEVMNFLSCRFIGNHGCISLNGTLPNNAVKIANCEFSSNTGFALVIINGSSLTFRDNTVQSNQMGGLYLEYIRGFDISANHFESNGATGSLIAVPSQAGRIKTDIILNGGGGYENLRNQNPCRQGVIRANTFHPLRDTAVTTAHVYANAVRDTDISNNVYHQPDPNLVFVAQPSFVGYSLVQNLDIHDNGGE